MMPFEGWTYHALVRFSERYPNLIRFTDPLNFSCIIDQIEFRHSKSLNKEQRSKNNIVINFKDFRWSKLVGNEKHLVVGYRSWDQRILTALPPLSRNSYSKEAIWDMLSVNIYPYSGVQKIIDI